MRGRSNKKWQTMRLPFLGTEARYMRGGLRPDRWTLAGLDLLHSQENAALMERYAFTRKIGADEAARNKEALSENKKASMWDHRNINTLPPFRMFFLTNKFNLKVEQYGTSSRI